MMFSLARIRKRGGFILLEGGSDEGKVATERSGKVAKDHEKQSRRTRDNGAQRESDKGINI
jgi:hypothetical protein